MALIGIRAQVAGRAQVGALGARQAELHCSVGTQGGQRAVGVVPGDRETERKQANEHRGGLGTVPGGQVGGQALLAVQRTAGHGTERVFDAVDRVCRGSQVGAQARQQVGVGHRRRAHGA